MEKVKRPRLYVDYTHSDKWISVLGDEDIRLEIDYDDVNHYVVDELIPLVLDALDKARDSVEWTEAIGKGLYNAEKAEQEELSRYN